MNEGQKNNSGIGRWFKLLFKIVLTVACLWYVSGKIDFAKAGLALKNANWIYLLFALIIFIISKLVAAIRLNIYFNNIGIHLSFFQNLKLYWLGMFYNLFLPGSISGDAYKVILLSKKLNTSYKKTTSAVLLDRLSGLLGLLLILAVYGSLVLKSRLFIVLIIAGSLIAIVVLYLVLKYWFKDFIQSYTSTLLLGVLVQAAQVIAVYLIMAALNIPLYINEYIFIFLVSSIAAVLPLTIGGLGIREVVFLEGSKYFGLVQEPSIVISLLFYLITLITSAFGLIYVFSDPLLQKNKDSKT